MKFVGGGKVFHCESKADYNERCILIEDTISRRVVEGKVFNSGD